MKRIIALSIFCLGLLTSRTSRAESQPADSNSLSSLSEEAFAEFTEALNLGKVFLKQNPPKLLPSGEESLIWAGSTAQTQASLKSGAVYFEGESARKTALLIDFKGKILSLKVPSAAESRFRDGFFAELSASAPAHAYLAEDSTSGFLITAPRTVIVNWTGFAICPLQIVTTQDVRKREYTKGVFSGLVPVTTFAKVNAKARGSYRSGSATAEVKVQISTTPNLAPLDRPEESVIESNPEAEIEYFPNLSEWKQDQAPQSLTSGIQASVELIAPGGQKMTDSSEALLAVKEFTLTKPTALTLSGKEIKVENPKCYAVLRKM